MWNIIYLFTGLAFYLLLFFVMIFKKTINNKATKLYKYLIIANGVEYIFELSLQFLVRNIELNSLLVTIFCRLYLCSILACYGVFSHYTSLICLGSNDNEKVKKKKVFQILNNALCIIGLVLILILPFEKYYDLNKMYIYGTAIDALKLFLGIYLVSWIVLSLSNIKTIIQKEYIPIITIIATIIFSVIIQSYDPSILVSTVFGTIICYTMYHTIENPDVKLLRELHNSKKISDNANEEKTIFLYNLTQEINSLVQDVNTDLDLILSQDNIEYVHNCARDLKSVVSSFEVINNEEIDLSKLSEDNIKTYKNKYNIKNIIRQIIEIYKDVCDNKGINFITNIDSNLPDYLYGDGIGLKKVISTILNNSTTYIDKGFVDISINSIIKNDICRLIITIEDSGLGIKSDEINRIIVSDSSLGDANRMINAMNGRMIMSSSYGEGTKTKIILDQKVDKSNNTIYDKYEKEFEYTNILAVDDSSYGLEIIKRLLKDMNVIYDSCLTEKDCIQKIKTNKYDLVLLDEQLVQISGTALAKKVKEINDSIPLVLLTKDKDYENNGLFSSVILKPIKKEDLISIMEKIKNEK